MTGTTFSSTRALLRLAIATTLVSPYLIWLAKISAWQWPTLVEWASPFANALVQASLSAFLSLGMGFVLFLAAQGWRAPRTRPFLEILLLLPNLVPPLFVALGLLSLFTPWMRFPYGMGAVVGAHVLINAGLVAIAFERLVQARLGGVIEAAWLLGTSRWRFWQQIGWPLLRQDVLSLFLFVFSICFTSFTLPLLLAGEQTLTLEVAILDLIRLQGRWDVAVILATTQTLALLLFALLLPGGFWPSRAVDRTVGFLGVAGLKWLVVLPTLIIFSGWSVGIVTTGIRHWPGDLPLLESVLTTLGIGLGTGLLHLMGFLLLAYVLPHAGLNRFLNGYLAPSPVITGFALLLLPGESEEIQLFKVMVAITLISFPLLYRWIVHSALLSLRQQIQTAYLMGSSFSQILFEIVWPQAAPQMLRASGLAALWSAGDFGLTGIVAGQLNTLPLLMESLINSYRLESAQLLLVPLLLLSLCLYGLFVGSIRYVSR